MDKSWNKCVYCQSYSGNFYDTTKYNRIYHLWHQSQVQYFLFCGATALIGPRPPGFEFYKSLTHSHTHAHTHTHGRTPLNEWSARRRGRYLHTTQQTQQKNMHAVSGSQTRDPVTQQPADLRLRRYGHRDRPWTILTPIDTLFNCYLTKCL